MAMETPALYRCFLIETFKACISSGYKQFCSWEGHQRPTTLRVNFGDLLTRRFFTAVLTGWRPIFGEFSP